MNKNHDPRTGRFSSSRGGGAARAKPKGVAKKLSTTKAGYRSQIRRARAAERDADRRVSNAGWRGAKMAPGRARKAFNVAKKRQTAARAMAARAQRTWDRT